MKVIPPLAITGAMFTTDAAETLVTYPTGSPFDEGERVLDPSGKWVYESLSPANSAALTDATKWIKVGPSNKWAMFDLLNSTPTVKATSLEVVITPGVRVNSIALLNVMADNVQITVESGGNLVYDSTVVSLRRRDVRSWYEYFFKPFTVQPTLILYELPPFTDAVITITFNIGSGNVHCGACVLGNFVDIGRVLAEAENDVLNFSSVTRDFDGGVSSMVQRRNVPKTIQAIVLDKSLVNRARDLRDSLNGVPAVWSGLDDARDEYFEAVLILGFYRRFSISLRHPQHAVISLELEAI